MARRHAIDCLFEYEARNLNLSMVGMPALGFDTSKLRMSEDRELLFVSQASSRRGCLARRLGRQPVIAAIRGRPPDP